ncbi:DUF5689 domain-containing protein [Mucilaginibacter sp.]|uniref:DUF5689 domain-containing protein n=1 Tax=Mucilaginibacter sp. TaxID=1882438 RepID=UPI00179D6D48|nr:DUF5689 domain-containing protein [Mucilaginibacter sp.]HEK22189.1 hypothetical protein [Bacteroidota bacterium]
MKTNSTFKHILLALTITCSMAACKKDKTNPEPTPPAEVKSMTFAEVKALSTGASVKVPDAKKIKGIVISDASAKNIDSKTVILQEASDKPGIVVTFDAAQTFAVNDEVEVTISNQTIAQVDGEVVLQNVPAANAKKTGTGTITAKETTIANVLANKAALNGTLVKIGATELTGGNGKFAGALNVKDASGELTTQVLTGAAFAGENLPASVSVLTGIVRISGSNVRIDIRKVNDVTIGAVSRIITENFENIASWNLDAPKFIGDTEFTTAFGHYWTEGNIFKYPGNLYDGNFTTAGRDYVYIYQTVPAGANPNGFATDYTNLQGVKTIKITFAGSKADKLVIADRGQGGNDIFNLNVFNEAVDYLQIGILPRDPSDGTYPYQIPNVIEKLLKTSQQYKKVGEFYTFTYTVPTKEELIAAGSDEAKANAWLAKPNFFIQNYSTRKGPDTDWQLQAPILLDKIEFGF